MIPELVAEIRVRAEAVYDMPNLQAQDAGYAIVDRIVLWEDYKRRQYGRRFISSIKGHAMKLTFPLVLFLIFLVLKLTHQIDWSWWWITAPMWAGTMLVFLGAVLYGIFSAFQSPERRKARQLRATLRALAERVQK